MTTTGPKIEIEGQIMLPVPSVTPEQAIANVDQVVAGWTCDRSTRMALEQSVKVLRELVEYDAARKAADAKGEGDGGTPAAAE